MNIRGKFMAIHAKYLFVKNGHNCRCNRIFFDFLIFVSKKLSN